MKHHGNNYLIILATAILLICSNCSAQSKSEKIGCGGYSITGIGLNEKQMEKVQTYLETYFHPAKKKENLCVFPLVVQTLQGKTLGLYRATILYSHFEPLLLLKHVDFNIDILNPGLSEEDAIVNDSTLKVFIMKYNNDLSKQNKNKILKEVKAAKR